MSGVVRAANIAPVSRPTPCLILVPLLLVLGAAPARPYGYTREDDPLVQAFRAAVEAARGGDLEAAHKQVERVQWQVDELKAENDLRVDLGPTLARAHQGSEASAEAAVQAWVNLVYLAVLQKFHWDLQEKLEDYHKARARLDAAQTYYELALAGNLKEDDRRRREADPQAPSRHEDVLASFKAAREALGSPGLFGVGARAPDLEAFRKATLRIAGHLNAVFSGFVRPGR